MFGNKIENYIVRVRNPNPVGGYYTVRFYFEDYYGNDRTESITKYLGPYEQKEFSYKDVNADRFKNYYWDYDII